MKKIKWFIGFVIGRIGAFLWEHGGWTGDERYEDLKITGKLGYRMFCTGLELMGIRPDDIGKLSIN